MCESRGSWKVFGEAPPTHPDHHRPHQTGSRLKAMNRRWWWQTDIPHLSALPNSACDAGMGCAPPLSSSPPVPPPPSPLPFLFSFLSSSLFPFLFSFLFSFLSFSLLFPSLFFLLLGDYFIILSQTPLISRGGLISHGWDRFSTFLGTKWGTKRVVPVHDLLPQTWKALVVKLKSSWKALVVKLKSFSTFSV